VETDAAQSCTALLATVDSSLPGIVGNTSLYNINGKRLLFASPVYCLDIVNIFIFILAIVSVLSREESLLTLASLDRIKHTFS